MLFPFGQSHCWLVARSPADVVLQTEDASDRMRDIITPMAGGLSSALTPLKGMVRYTYTWCVNGSADHCYVLRCFMPLSCDRPYQYCL